MNSFKLRFFSPVLISVCALTQLAYAQEPATQLAEAETPDMTAKFEEFQKTLNQATLVGRFTIVGKDVAPKEERYEIKSVKKMDKGDYWLFMARVKYGKNDVTLPMPLEVKWVANTPVITLDNVTIPGLGTFSSYVVIDKDKYAGTWTHGKVSGHLFGKIEHEKESNQEATE